MPRGPTRRRLTSSSSSRGSTRAPRDTRSVVASSRRPAARSDRRALRVSLTRRRSRPAHARVGAEDRRRCREARDRGGDRCVPCARPVRDLLDAAPVIGSSSARTRTRARSTRRRAGVDHRCAHRGGWLRPLLREPLCRRGPRQTRTAIRGSRAPSSSSTRGTATHLRDRRSSHASEAAMSRYHFSPCVSRPASA